MVQDTSFAFKEPFDDPLAATHVAISSIDLLLCIVGLPDRFGCVTIPGVASLGETFLGPAFIGYVVDVELVQSDVVTTILNLKFLTKESCQK